MELPGWKSKLSWVAAVALAVLFLISGVWKITDPQGWAARIMQLRVPGSLSLAAALGCGIAETVGAAMILVPALRRWGAILIGALLVAFVAYFAVNYGALRGADCSCFPWVKRVVGPGFFAGDGLMLVLAVVAGAWSKPAGSVRTVFVIAGAVTVFALASYGAQAVRQTGVKAPDSIMVDGRPYSLEHGRYFLFFFHPSCMHCFEAAKQMSHFEWGATTVVVVPVEMPQFAAQFLEQTGLKAVVSPDFQKLKTVFGYTTYPFGVALENGRERAQLVRFDDVEPAATLKNLGFVN